MTGRFRPHLRLGTRPSYRHLSKALTATRVRATKLFGLPTSAVWSRRRICSRYRRVIRWWIVSKRTRGVSHGRGSFPSASAALPSAMRFQPFAPLLLAVFHAEAPEQETQSGEDAVERQKRGQD